MIRAPSVFSKRAAVSREGAGREDNRRNAVAPQVRRGHLRFCRRRRHQLDDIVVGRERTRHRGRAARVDEGKDGGSPDEFGTAVGQRSIPSRYSVAARRAPHGHVVRLRLEHATTFGFQSARENHAVRLREIMAWTS